MNDFDDDLRRLFSDDRLTLSPRPDAVGRILKGAHRRRTTRVVATSVGTAGLLAAVTVGSVAVAGQFTDGAGGVAPATGSTTSDSPAPATDPVVVYPNVGIDGFTVGTPLTELETIAGVEITPFEPNSGYSDVCYGEYRSANAHGVISLRGSWGETPDPLRPHLEVASMHFDTPVSTPEGITVGSPESDVVSTYPGVSDFNLGDRYRAEFADPTVIVRAWEFHVSGGTVSEIVMDGLPSCEQTPVLAPGGE